MFSLNSSMRFYLYPFSTDMRKSFDGLSGIILSRMQKKPQDGSVYIFLNKNRNKIKLLHWESGGFVLYYKRLEQGTIEKMASLDSVNHLSLTWTQLVLLIEGISIKNTHKRKRYIG